MLWGGADGFLRLWVGVSMENVSQSASTMDRGGGVVVRNRWSRRSPLYEFGVDVIHVYALTNLATECLSLASAASDTSSLISSVMSCYITQ